MPLKVSDINKRTKALTFTFEVDGQTEDVSLVYRPGWYTVERERELRELVNDSSHRAEQITTTLAQMLVSWDVTDEKGKPYPVTLDALQKVDADGFLSAVFMAIMEDLHPNLRTAVNSGAGSSTAAA
ncbi:MAG: hypothetical protein KGL39_22745 [Patescibacteria group bacterium]|nr:hypothetical protein [Patescibacteria group bacterium]